MAAGTFTPAARLRALAARAALPACLAAAALTAACRPTDPQPDSAQDPAPPTAQKYACPDLDGDAFSTVSLCTPQDCNDDRDFAHPDLGYCEEHPYLECVPAGDWQAADFAFLQVGKRYHVFYIKGPFWQLYPDTHGKAFGHESTLDGLTWEYLGDPFAVAAGSDWDDLYVWSPCIVKNPADGRFYMFYTGVTDGIGGHEERIGLATSANLADWVREPAGGCAAVASPGCLFEPDFAWNAWSQAGYWTKQCRDPHVWYDDVNLCWYMVYSTAPAPFAWSMVLGLARSPDLRSWQDCGPIPVTAGQIAESAVMLRVEGIVHLLWTFDDQGGIKHSTAADPQGGAWSAPVVLEGSVLQQQLAAELLAKSGWFVLGYVQDFARTLHFKFLEFPADGGAPRQGPLASLACSYVPAAGVFPGAAEWPNGIDDNCNGLIDEGQGPCQDADGDLYGDPDSQFCARLGWDCDDTDPLIHPGAQGSCADSIDNNCNGLVDDLQECTAKFPTLITRY